MRSVRTLQYRRLLPYLEDLILHVGSDANQVRLDWPRATSDGRYTRSAPSSTPGQITSLDDSDGFYWSDPD